jgi:hypothetical protein
LTSATCFFVSLNTPFFLSWPAALFLAISDNVNFWLVQLDLATLKFNVTGQTCFSISLYSKIPHQCEVMKKSRMVAVITAFFLFVSGYGIAVGQSDSAKPSVPPAAAEHTDHAGHGTAQPTDKPAVHTGGHEMSQMYCMGGKSKQEDAIAAHIKDMQALMEKINVTDNPSERKKLMAEHMAMMASSMKMMREMDDTMMMEMMKSGKCPMMEMMSSPQGHEGMKGMMDGNMPMCHTMMQKKAERNYAMMEQIIESQKQLLKLAP